MPDIHRWLRHSEYTYIPPNGKEIIVLDDDAPPVVVRAAVRSDYVAVHGPGHEGHAL